MMNKRHLLLGLLFITTALSLNVSAMLPQENQATSNLSHNENSVEYDYVNTKLTKILAEVSENKKNGPKILPQVRELKDHLLALTLDDTTRELIAYVIDSLNDMQSSFLEKQSGRVTVINYFKTTIKALTAKVASARNSNNKNNNNNLSSASAPIKRKIAGLLPQNDALSQSHFVLDVEPQLKKIRIEDSGNEQYVSPELLFQNKSNNALGKDIKCVKNSKKRKRSSSFIEVSNTTDASDNAEKHIPIVKKSCFELSPAVYEKQSPLSKKLWGRLAEDEKQRIRSDIDRYRSFFGSIHNDECRANIAIDEKMPVTPLIAALKLSNATDVLMLVDAGVDCNMQVGGEVPIILAIQCFMKSSSELDRVFLKMFDKVEMNSVLAENLISSILTAWKCIGDVYLSYHASAKALLCILERMRNENIQLKNVNLIYQAIETNSPTCLEYILKHCDDSINFDNISRPVEQVEMKLVFEMLHDRRISMLKVLLKSGKFTPRVQKQDGSFFHSEIFLQKDRFWRSDLFEIIDLIIDLSDINKQDSFGYTLFHMMALHMPYLSSLKDWDKLYYKLIINGANPNIETNTGLTPLALLNPNSQINEKIKNKEFLLRFNKILHFLSQKAVINKSGKDLMATLWSKLCFQSEGYQEYETQSQPLDSSHFEILDN